VVLLATGCEEAGLRGAKRFARQHAAELWQTPTFGLFLDGIYDERWLGVVRREYSTGARYDEQLAALACDVAALRGWEVKSQKIPIGGTDAAAFSRIGVPAVTLVGMDCQSLVENYHTRLDTLDRVRPEGLARMLQIVVDMLERLDRECCGFADSHAASSPEPEECHAAA
jgi:putative aminopeptidase FrvX